MTGLNLIVEIRVIFYLNNENSREDFSKEKKLANNFFNVLGTKMLHSVPKNYFLEQLLIS